MTEPMDQLKATLPSVLQWNPHLYYDPVPEWWLRGLDTRVSAQILATRLDTQQKILAAQMEGLAEAAKILRSNV